MRDSISSTAWMILALAAKACFTCRRCCIFWSVFTAWLCSRNFRSLRKLELKTALVSASSLCSVTSDNRKEVWSKIDISWLLAPGLLWPRVSISFTSRSVLPSSTKLAMPIPSRIRHSAPLCLDQPVHWFPTLPKDPQGCLMWRLPRGQWTALDHFPQGFGDIHC